MKYFVLGAIASGTMLYGFSIVYGLTGTLQLDELAIAVREVGPGKLGLVFGLAFIVAASRSSSAPCRSTCGFPTSITARRRR